MIGEPANQYKRQGIVPSDMNLYPKAKYQFM